MVIIRGITDLHQAVILTTANFITSGEMDTGTTSI